MNYVGAISIVDRGDAPAQAVIDRNARSVAQRVADETKDELKQVLQRVDHVSPCQKVLWGIGSDNSKASNSLPLFVLKRKDSAGSVTL